MREVKVDLFPGRRMSERAHSGFYEAVIKVDRKDPADLRAKDIAEGIGYACTLLHDEYGWTPGAIADVLERVTDNIYDDEARREDYQE